MTSHIRLLLFILVISILFSSPARAELSINSVYPNVGKVGQDLEVTIRGSGFDENTRVSMSLDAGNRMQIIGSVDTPDNAREVAMNGQIAYVADGGSGIMVVDFKDPSHPRIIGTLDTPGWAEAITAVGETAFVADGDSGLQVIDMTNPSQPKIIGAVDTPGNARDVSVTGKIAYVAADDRGLQVIDISDPSQPVIIGSIEIPGTFRGVKVTGDTAYVAVSKKGLYIIDVSTPSNPVLMGSVDTIYFAYDVTVKGRIAYVADYARGLQVIDITNPSNPVIVGLAETPGAAWGVTVVGKTAFVADYNNGLQVIDISDPYQPDIIGAVDIPGTVFAVTVVDDTAYVSNGWDGVRAIDITNPSLPNIIGVVDTPGSAEGVTMAGDTVYVADGSSGLQVIDITDPSNPEIIGSVMTPKNAIAVAVEGDIAYVAAHDSGLQVIDISDPFYPGIIGSVDISGAAWGLMVVDDTAYVADIDTGLQIIDVTDPAHPNIIGSVDTPDYARGVTVMGETAYVADSNSGLQVINIRNPSLPNIIGSMDTPGSANAVANIGTTVYLADSFGGLQVFDVKTPSRPKIIGSLEAKNATAISIKGNTACLADGSNGLHVIDIEDPSNPSIIGTMNINGYIYDATVAEGAAFLACGGQGLFIVPLTVEVSLSHLVSSTELQITLPGPSIEGNYNIRVFNQSESDELTGAVSFFKTTDYQVQRKKKAIIAVGGNGDPSDRLTIPTKICANYAYLSLLSQGYARENIEYLSFHSNTDVDGDGNLNDVDGPCTSSTLSYAISDWASDASELIVYLVDHGGKGTFKIGPGDVLNASELDSWLDTVQSYIPGKVILIYDACYSGSFLPLMKAPAGKQRIVVTSSQADQLAWFMNDGVLSFSYQFWASVFVNANLYDSFITAKNMMVNDQACIIDANSDGIQTKADVTILKDFLIGRGRVAGSSPPSIGSVCGKQTLDGNTSSSLWTDSITSLNPIKQVWAVIVPPGYENGNQGTAVTELDTVKLSDPDKDGKYTGVYNNFTLKGTYSITIHAEDNEGFMSLPITTSVIQSKGTGTTPPPVITLQADFNASPRSGTAPLTVNFTDTSTGNVSQWEWDFDDGYSNNRQNPSFTYTKPGQYTIGLTVNDGASSSTKVKTNFITVTSGNGSGGTQTTQPIAPTGIAASDGIISGKVRVTWNASSGAASYDVYRADMPAWAGASPKRIAASVSGTTYDDATAKAGSRYYYWVKARNAGGVSKYSMFDTGYWGSVGSIPPVPQNTKATDGSVSGKVTITWNATANTLVYEIWRADIPAFLGGKMTKVGTSILTSYDDATAVSGKRYYYWIKARNSWGVSRYSKFDTGYHGKASSPLSAPTGVTASDGTISGKVKITWNTVSDADLYEVWRATKMVSDGGKPIRVGYLSGTSFDDTSAAKGTIYYYWAKSRDCWGSSKYSVPDTGYSRP